MVDRKHPLAKCEECPLYTHGQYVPTKHATHEHTHHSQAVFVGEAPANQERITGEPFVGPSGRVLNAVLAEHDITRDSVTLTNSTLCHYPQSWGEIPRQAVDACRDRLVDDITRSGAPVVVGMGNTALYALHGVKSGITKYRQGPPRPSLYLPPDILTVSTIHPAACLRNQSQFPLMEADIAKAVTYSHVGSDVLWTEPHVIVPDTEAEAFTILQRLYNDMPLDYKIVVDTESGQDKDESDSVALDSELLCIGVTDTNPDDHRVFVFFRDVMDLDYTRSLFLELLKQHGTVMQNGKYDINVLRAFLHATADDYIPLDHDTLLSSYSINETPGIHSLDYMSKEYIGTPDYKDEPKKHMKKGKAKNFAEVPRDVLCKYNGWDVQVTKLLYFYQLALIKSQHLEPINKFLLDASPLLTDMEQSGMMFDMKRSKELEADYLEHIERVEKDMPLNPRSPKQILEYFNNQSNGKRVISDTQQSTLEALDDKLEGNEPILKSILESRKYTKLNSTYAAGLQKLVRGDGKIHPSFRLHGTTTGRLASRKPNAQNIPRGSNIKEQFIPDDEDHVWVQADYSQAELRTLTWLAQDTLMRDLFNDPNRDVFTELCITLFGSDYTSLPKAEQKDKRTLVKTFAYGISYGREAFSIAKAFDMSVTEATNHMNAFRAMIPDIIAFQKEVIRKIHNLEDLVNPFGRHRRFYLINESNRKNLENEAMAYLPQSTASDMCLRSAVILHWDYGLDIRNLVHDSILVHAERGDEERIASLTNEIMCSVAEEVTQGYVRFATDYTVGENWSQV